MSLSVLVVDDSAFARKVLCKSLTSIFSEKDMVLSEADNGEKALSEILNGTPDILFLDLTMPVMNGYQLLAEIQKLNIKIPTIVISADVQQEAVKKVEELGVLGFLRKPLNHDQVTGLLKEVKLI